MIKEISRNDIPECAAVIRDSFRTVADEPGFTEENALPVHCLCDIGEQLISSA